MCRKSLRNKFLLCKWFLTPWKKIICYFLLPLLALLVACNSTSTRHTTNTKNKADTLSYTIKTISRKDKDCMQPDSTKCNILSVSYPLFDKQPVLNDSLKNILLAIFPIEHSSSSLDAQADQFLKEYEAFKKEPYAAGRQYVLQGSVKILTHTPSFIALQTNAYIYIGGAPRIFNCPLC